MTYIQLWHTYIYWLRVTAAAMGGASAGRTATSGKDSHPLGKEPEDSIVTYVVQYIWVHVTQNHFWESLEQITQAVKMVPSTGSVRWDTCSNM